MVAPPLSSDKVALRWLPQHFVSSILCPGREPHVCADQWVREAPCYTHLWVEGPLVCAPWCPPVSTGSSSRRGGWGHTKVTCRSAREPGWSSCLLRTYQVKVNSGAHPFLWSWVVPSAPKELPWFPDILYVVPLLCRSYSINSLS